MGRHDQCDNECTYDCGTCKGQGLPEARPHDELDLIERFARGHITTGLSGTALLWHAIDGEAGLLPLWPADWSDFNRALNVYCEASTRLQGLMRPTLRSWMEKLQARSELAASGRTQMRKWY